MFMYRPYILEHAYNYVRMKVATYLVITIAIKQQTTIQQTNK